MIPALEGKTSSQIVAENLNAVHAARKGFIKSEFSNKIRHALKHIIWHQNGTLKRILCAHVDDFLFGGTQEFLDSTINPVRKSSLLDLKI